MDTIEYFQQSANYECLAEIRDNLKYIKNTKRILKRIREATASMNDWVNLYKVREE
jgi:DNA mismatch repair ATPase MutS